MPYRTIVYSKSVRISGSLLIGSSSSDVHRVTGSTLFKGNVSVTGSITPGSDNAHDLGSSASRWANLYTGDLHLKNERGDWTIVEEEDYLSVINNKTKKNI